MKARVNTRKLYYIITVNGTHVPSQKTGLRPTMREESMSAQGITQNHVDAIAVMPEDELNRSMRRAQEQLGAMRREGASPGLRRYAEEEVCYLQREVNHRATRRAAHEAWLARNPGFRTGGR